MQHPACCSEMHTLFSLTSMTQCLTQGSALYWDSWCSHHNSCRYNIYCTLGGDIFSLCAGVSVRVWANIYLSFHRRVRIGQSLARLAPADLMTAMDFQDGYVVCVHYQKLRGSLFWGLPGCPVTLDQGWRLILMDKDRKRWTSHSSEFPKSS